MSDELKEELDRLGNELLVTQAALLTLLVALSKKDPDLVRGVAVDLTNIAVDPILRNVLPEDRQAMEALIAVSEEFADDLLAAIKSR